MSELQNCIDFAGKIEFVQDRALGEKVLNDRPFLKSFGLTVESAGLVIFRIAHAHYR